MILSAADILRILQGSSILRLSAKLKIADGRPQLSGAEGLCIYIDRFPRVDEFEATWTIYIESDGSEPEDLVIKELQRLLPGVQLLNSSSALFTVLTTTDFLSESTQRPLEAPVAAPSSIDVSVFNERFEALAEDVQDRMLLVTNGRNGLDGADGKDGKDGADGKDIYATETELADLSNVEMGIPMEKGQVLTWDGTEWTNLFVPQLLSATVGRGSGGGGGGGAVDSVNGQTGVVVLDAEDVGAATEAQGDLADTAVQPGDDISTLNNDVGYITAAEVPPGGVTSVNTQTGDVVLTASDVGAATAVQGDQADANLVSIDAINVEIDDINEELGQTTSLAKGAALNLKQELLAAAGQPALTVLAVAATTTGKVQGISLGDGNVIEVFADGAAFNNATVLYREFMSAGEPICFTGLSPGAIITSAKGFYGACEQYRPEDTFRTGPMPLLSLGLAFTDTFIFCFRNSNNPTGAQRGEIYITAGPLPTEVTLTRGAGAEVYDPSYNNGEGREQNNIPLQPFESTVLVPDANTEFRILATNPVMGAVQSYMGTGVQEFMDTRLIMPLTSDGVLWAKSGYISAPYENTVVRYYERDGDTGNFGVSPGSPVRLAGIPVGQDSRYQPDGATRMIAQGLISGFSGADDAGSEATPMLPVNAMSQIVPQPYFISDAGNGGNSGVSIASLYTGTAKIYEWNSTTAQADLAYTVELRRGNDGGGIPLTSPAVQRFPVAGQVANEPGLAADVSVVQLTGNLNFGYIVADVPIVAVCQTRNNFGAPAEIRSQEGTTTAPILSNSDETLMLGITPKTLKAEITEDTDAYLRKRTISNIGIETWPLA